MSRSVPVYVELHAHSHHSLLDGVASPADLVAAAAAMDMPALALTDRDALYGIVPFIRSAEAAGIQPIVGAEMTLQDGAGQLVLLAENAEGYANLCRLITLAHRDQPKGHAALDPACIGDHSRGLIALSGSLLNRLLLTRKVARAHRVARHYAGLFGPQRFYVELQRHLHRGERRLLQALRELADTLGLPTVATTNARYVISADQHLHDVLTCIRYHTTLDQAGDLLLGNAEYRLRSPAEMGVLFPDDPAALRHSMDIAERCAPGGTFLRPGHQILPTFPTPENAPAGAYLRCLCERELSWRYPHHPPAAQLRRELALIGELGLDNYFLIVADIARFAREAGIAHQGRGSAANSLVAYLLGISPIDPVAVELVFERFLSRERPRPPDIDIDFAADRREEVIQYLYHRYGRDHVAMACTLVTYRSRSAVRDVARALGFPAALVGRLSKVLDLHHTESVHRGTELAHNLGVDLSATAYQHLLRLAQRLQGIPRHLGIHNGGMILSGPPLATLVPIEPATMPKRTVVQWDKEALEDAGIIKVDILGLRMLSAVHDAVVLIEKHGGPSVDLDRIPPDDPEVYAMLARGQTVGVFQVESRAQANLIPNFKPRSLADLAIQISLIRPGPLQANMVRPYLRRRQGREPVRFLHPLLKPALAETLGVIVFQEQVLKIARDLAGFTAGEGEQLRRALGSKRAAEAVGAFRERFVMGAAAKGVPQTIAEAVFAQLEAFGGYAFAKSHAAAFAVLAYRSAYLRRYHPAAFFAGLLRHQPMGFYPAHVIVSEARRLGVRVLPVDIVASEARTDLEILPDPPPALDTAIRLGLDTVRGLGSEVSTAIVTARRQAAFRSLDDLCRRGGLGRRTAEALILAGALDGWGLPRRQLVWDLEVALQEARSESTLHLQGEDTPVFAALPNADRMLLEHRYTGVSASGHLYDVVARQLRTLGATLSGDLARWPAGTRVRVGGVVVARQQPPTANGMAFLAVEDAQGLINVAVSSDVLTACREAVSRRFIMVEGRVRWEGRALSITASRVVALAPLR